MMSEHSKDGKRYIKNKTYADNPDITTRDEVDEFRGIPS